MLAAGVTPHIFRYRTTTAHSGTWILQGVDDVACFLLKSLYPCLQHTETLLLLQQNSYLPNCILPLKTLSAQAQRTITYIHGLGHPPPSRCETTWSGLVVIFFYCSTQRSHGHPAPLPPHQFCLPQTTTLLPVRTCTVPGYVNAHTYPWPGDPKLTIIGVSPGFVIYPCKAEKLDEDFGRRVNTFGVLAAGITPHIVRYRWTTAHSGMWILQGVDDIAASC